MESLLLGILLEYCINDSDVEQCKQVISDCVEQKIWYHYDHAANREVTDELVLDFTKSCMENHQ